MRIAPCGKTSSVRCNKMVCCGAARARGVVQPLAQGRPPVPMEQSLADGSAGRPELARVKALPRC